jgi:uncharacterized repeat protein (TIGR03806 family)
VCSARAVHALAASRPQSTPAPRRSEPALQCRHPSTLRRSPFERALARTMNLGAFVSGCAGGEPNPSPQPYAEASGCIGDAVKDAAVLEVPSGLDERIPNRTCRAPAVAPAGAHWVNPFPRLPAFSKPVALRRIPGDHGAWFVLEQGGRVFEFENSSTVTSSRVVLDITDRVAAVENGGLLGLAFHPRFTDSPDARFAYVFYTAPVGTATSRLSRFPWPKGAASIDPRSEETLVTVAHDHVIHLNDDLHFGPDGYLYASMGDGGGLGRAQDPFDLRGKVWRIDVDAQMPYGIPVDNPYARGSGAPEVYALGLRNPFRFGFDRETGALYAGDVGNYAVEEINRIEAGQNYGWSCFEGGKRAPAEWNLDCPDSGFTAPIHTYNREGSVGSVTGGRVYRGTAMPWLVGKYVFGDFSTTQIWALDPKTRTATDLGASGLNVVDFAESHYGEIYITDFGSGTFRKLVPGVHAEPPTLLSETGCFDPDNPFRPLPALIPFDVRVPSWSDGATKRRWMALPDCTTIHIETTGDRKGDFTFPPGTVLIKELSLRDGTRVETRFFVQDEQGHWSGYSYQWRADQSDATLIPSLPDALVVSWGSADWEYPSRSQCFACHSRAAGWALGLESAQLNSMLVYPKTGRRANQLTTLAYLGMFDGETDLSAWMRTALPTLEGDAALDDRARALLHTNCAQCHRPGGLGGGSADFRFGIALSEMRICDIAPFTSNSGIQNARLLAPGFPASSMLLSRMARRGPGQMPPLATRLPDDPGLALVRRWIAGLESCGRSVAHVRPSAMFSNEMAVSNDVRLSRGSHPAP